MSSGRQSRRARWALRDSRSDHRLPHLIPGRSQHCPCPPSPGPADPCASPVPCSISAAQLQAVPPLCPAASKALQRNPHWVQPAARQAEGTDVGLLHQDCSSHSSPVATALTRLRRKHPGEREVEGGDLQFFLADAQVAESRQELSCWSVLTGTPGSLPIHATVMDQPPSQALCSPTLSTLGVFFPTPSLGAFLWSLKEYMSPTGPREALSPAVWAATLLSAG